jgi:hypothetical protein
MMEDTTETVPAVSTFTNGADSYQSFVTDETVEAECLCCSTDRFRYFETMQREHHVTGRFECIGCGAITEKRIPRTKWSESR